MRIIFILILFGLYNFGNVNCQDDDFSGPPYKFKGHNMFVTLAPIDAGMLRMSCNGMYSYGDQECYGNNTYFDPRLDPRRPLVSTCDLCSEIKNNFARVDYRGNFGPGWDPVEEEEVENRTYVLYNDKPIIGRGFFDEYNSMIISVRARNARIKNDPELIKRVRFLAIEDYALITLQFSVLEKINASHCGCKRWRWQEQVKISDYVERRPLKLKPKRLDQHVPLVVKFESACVSEKSEKGNATKAGIFCNCLIPQNKDEKKYRCDIYGRKVCLSAFNGENCTDTNECENPYYCLNGKCTNLEGSFRCDCKKGYYGRRCELSQNLTFDVTDKATCKEAPYLCQNYGKCDTNGPVPKCKCTDDYTGDFCQLRKKYQSWLVVKLKNIYQDLFIRKPIQGGMVIVIIGMAVIPVSLMLLFKELQQREHLEF